MNKQTEGLRSSTPSNVPIKRKRGRPRKQESGGVQGENKPVIPGSANNLNSNHTASLTNECGDEMLGKVVACVIEGTFSGGYLVNVQVAADTFLRGVVFLPERVVPVTAENDVARQVRMIKRKYNAIPILNPETQIHSSIPSSGQCNNLDETLHEVDASREAKEPNADGRSTKYSEESSEPINLVPTDENTEKELTTGQQSLPSVYKLNELIPKEPRHSIIGINQIPVYAEHAFMPSEQINKTVDCFMQKQGSPETGAQEDTETKLCIETSNKVDTTGIAGIANILDVELNNALQFSHPSKCEGEAVPSEYKHFSSFGAVNNVDVNQPTEVLVTSLEFEKPIGSDASSTM